MALINYAKKEINAKIVYYGPGLSGKTTNIQYVYQRLRPEHRGKLITLPTQTDRTLFFDFLPVEIPNVRGFTTRFHLYTVPGQVFYNATRKMVLKGVDGVVFVADSQQEKLEDNIESLHNLQDNLREYGKNLEILPIVFQYNKRDLSELTSVRELNKKLNTMNYASFEAVATQGKGVMETLTAISRMVLKNLKDTYDSQKILRYDDPRGDAKQEITMDEGAADIPPVEPPSESEEGLEEIEAEVVEPEAVVSETGAVEQKRPDLGVMGEFGNEPDEGQILDTAWGGGVAGGEDSPASEPTVEVTIEPGENSVDLVLGGEIERTGPASFRVPLTFRLHNIQKDIVLNINLQLSDSGKDRDIF
jgi:signal recognition particle receptor subunit beta